MRSWVSPQRLPFCQDTEQSQNDGIGLWPHGVQNLKISVDYSIFFSLEKKSFSFASPGSFLFVTGPGRPVHWAFKTNIERYEAAATQTLQKRE